MHQEFFDLLHKDHEEVDNILSQLERASSEARQQQLEHLREEVMPHMHAEEEAYYSRLVENPKSKKDAEEGIKEHKQAESTLKRLVGMSTRSAEWMATFHELKECIQHHVQDEESKIFELTREVISEDQMQTIMTEFEKAKETERAGMTGSEGIKQPSAAGGKVSAAQFAVYMKGIDFPADKERLAEQAKSNGAPQNVVQMMNQLPEKEYRSAAEVEQDFGKIK